MQHMARASPWPKPQGVKPESGLKPKLFNHKPSGSLGSAAAAVPHVLAEKWGG